MKELRKAAETLALCLKEKNITKAAWTVSETEKKEFTAEQDGFSLYRTLFGEGLSLSVFMDGRKGSVSGNDISDEGIKAAVEDAIASAMAAPVDEANDIAPYEGVSVFSKGTYECDEDALFKAADQLRTDILRDYPKILLMQIIAEHEKVHALYQNTNGTEFETYEGVYSVSPEYAGNDGVKTTGIAGSGLVTIDLETPLIDQGGMRTDLSSTEAQLDEVELTGKMTCPVIFTPSCTNHMIYFLMNSFLDGQLVLNGTGLWNDKIGQKVASDKVTIAIKPSDESIVSGSDYTAEGFRTNDLLLLEKGVLFNQIISLYVANKTGREPSKCDSHELVMMGGDVSFDDMVKSIDRGLLVGGFSGGRPGSNGEISGVAKNSFLIENGEIKGAVSETMISGNLAEMFMNVTAVSEERCLNGYSAIPYMKVEGIVVSGKSK